jgi:hypothetical protein
MIESERQALDDDAAASTKLFRLSGTLTPSRKEHRVGFVGLELAAARQTAPVEVERGRKLSRRLTLHVSSVGAVARFRDLDRRSLDVRRWSR